MARTRMRSGWPGVVGVIVISHGFEVAKAAVFVLIFALASPMFLFGTLSNAEARDATEPSTLIESAPPEPFVLGNPVSQSSLASAMTARLAGSFSSLAAFFAPVSTETKKRDVRFAKLADESETESAEEVLPQPLPSPRAVAFDFEGDGKADIGRWHAANYEYVIRKSNGSGNINVAVGSSSAAKAAPGDYDGNSAYNAAVFNNGTWTIDGIGQVTFGVSGDKPVSGYYDSDNIMDLAVFTPSTSTWYVKRSTDGGTSSMGWGISGDIPAPGDFDGDGKNDYAVFRPSNGTWYVNKSNGGTITRGWGLSGDVPVPVDFDGDGATDIAVFRPSNGTWYVATSISGFNSTFSQTWGNYGDQPVPADYDGDGIADIAIWRPKTGTWHIIYSSNSSINTYVLGVSGNVAVPSAYLAQSAFNVPNDELGKARLSPKNATGGTNLYSQNFSWGTSLVGLPGRSGLDMGFGIGYNSLVWTKVGSTMVFDADAGSLTPGFRFGFPVIEPVFMNHLDDNPQVDKFTYMMISPSGARVEFRETSVAGYYETVDGSYAQLQTIGSTNPNDPADELTIKVTTTDGTQMSYEWSAGAFRCVEIKDRNGNKISIDHDDYGNLLTVTDTLGRVVTVNYANGAPSTITQTWKTDNGAGPNTTPYPWATFSYTGQTINTNFQTGLGVAGPLNGSTINVLDKITYADGSFTKFTYNTYGQVWKVENYAADISYLNSVWTDQQTPAANQPDCPKFEDIWTKTANFNGGTEIKTDTTRTASQSFSLPGSLPNSGTLITVQMTGHPHNGVSKSIVSSSGWSEGLTIATEDWADGTSGSERKRWTWANWTQDDTTAQYSINPRVIEAQVGDGTNTKKTQVDYELVGSTNVALYGRVGEVRLYDTNLSTVLKKITTDYEDGSIYLTKRLVNLPVLTELRDASNVLWSKTTYAYDGEAFNQETNQVPDPITQHDTAYGSSFVTGRGNLTSVTRHDVTGQTASVTSKTRYDIAGSVVSQLDPLNRKVRFEYNDVFNDSINRNSYAYPTRVYDPAGNYSEVKYRFDIGANVWAKSPAPAGNSTGKETTREYDDKGRILKQKIENNGAYTRYEYPTNGVQTKVFSTLVDNGTAGIDSGDEVATETWADGAGRVRRAMTEHPGSYNGWSGVQTEYDILGRARRTSLPTELTVNGDDWIAAGDDAAPARGWLWNTREFDWMGRPVRIIPSDSTGTDGKDTLISYEGCGCAGGQAVTVQGPIIKQSYGIGQTETTVGRRKQRVESDILGRQTKAILYQWDGSTVYSTIGSEYNGRDQIILKRHYQGAASSTTYQDTVWTFDGHGRLKTEHKPEQNSQTATSYNYNLDDSIQSVTDSRGAVANYTYENIGGTPKRALVTGVSWTVPGGSGITDPADVSYVFDNAGNRTSMTDGLGTMTYAYNSLSQMTSETRAFNTSQPTALQARTFALSYTYQLNGSLKSVTDPYEDTINYTHDKAGRLATVTGTAFGTSTSVDEYLNNVYYRAWGAVKQADYWDAGLRLYQTFESSSSRLSTYNMTFIGNGNMHLRKDYYYYGDGQARFIRQDYNGEYDSMFDRYYEYDFAGRMTKAYTGDQARTGTQNADYNQIRPYVQNLTYDNWSNVTNRDARRWTDDVDLTNSFNAATNRETTWSYDADGRVTLVPPTSNNESKNYAYKFDAAGQLVENDSYLNGEAATPTRLAMAYDGDGKIAQRKQTTHYSTPPVEKFNFYFINSSVLGGVALTEIDKEARKKQTIVNAYGKALAYQRVSYSGSTATEVVNWDVRDPSGTSIRGVGSFELDPDGMHVGMNNPDIEQESYTVEPDDRWHPFIGGGGGAILGNWGCQMDGINVPCRIARTMLYNGSASRCPDNFCGPRVQTHADGSQNWTSPFMAFANGATGYHGWLRTTFGATDPDTNEHSTLAVWWDRMFFPNANPSDFRPGFEPPDNNRHRPFIGPAPPRPPRPSRPPREPLDLTPPCLQVGIGFSGTAAIGVGPTFTATGGAVLGVDRTGGSATTFIAPSGGIVAGGSSIGGSVGAPSNEGVGIGFIADVGPSFFISNARDPGELRGITNTHILGLGLVNFQWGRDPKSNTQTLDIGPGAGFGYFYLKTQGAKPLVGNMAIRGDCGRLGR